MVISGRRGGARKNIILHPVRKVAVKSDAYGDLNSAPTFVAIVIKLHM